MDAGMKIEIRFFLTFYHVFLNSRCGSGNKKATVMDAIDACCKAHDKSYQGWDSSASYYLINNYDCNKMFNRTSGRYNACVCDKTAAQCFARNKYNPKMRFHTFK